jgi:hypothetical protein
MTLLQTDFLPTKSEAFQAFRYLMQDMVLQEGVVNSGDYKAIQHTPNNMTVDVAAGSAWVLGGAVTRQGIYHQINDATVNVGNFANSDPTNPRIDQVLLVVNDSSAIGGSDNPQFIIAQGTATAGATLDNRSGAVVDATLNSTYHNWVRIADVLIPAASSSVVTANIRDRRPWARGALRAVRRTAAFAGSATSMTSIDTATLQTRLETSGAPICIKFNAYGNAPAAVGLGCSIDGAQPDGLTYLGYVQNITTNGPLVFDYTLATPPAAGSHLFTATYLVTSGTVNLIPIGTAAELTVEETVRQNADNT